MILNDSYAVEDSMCKTGEKINEDILEDASFFARFLDFVKKYDEAFGKDSFSSAEKWVSEKDYTSIKYFLKPNAIESVFSISYPELATMTVSTFADVQIRAQRIVPVLEEQKSLYEELLKAYETPCLELINNIMPHAFDDDLGE